MYIDLENWYFEDTAYAGVENDGDYLRYVRNGYQTEKVCKKAVSKRGESLRYVFHKTETFVKLAVKQDGLALRYSPHRYRTETICKIAVKQNGLALQYVPYELRNEEITLLAIKQCPDAIEYAYYNDDKFFIKSFSHSDKGETIRFCDFDNRNKILCILAAESHIRASRYCQHYTTEIAKHFNVSEFALGEMLKPGNQIVWD